MGARRAPSPFAVVYAAAVLGAAVVIAWRPLVGFVVFLTTLTVLLVWSLVQAERAQARYRASLAAKVARRPWSEADVLADEAALVEARRARLAASMARPAHGRYDMRFSSWQAKARAADVAPRRVVIDRHEPIERAS